jgi:hypothetical protein
LFVLFTSHQMMPMMIMPIFPLILLFIVIRGILSRSAPPYDPNTQQQYDVYTQPTYEAYTQPQADAPVQPDAPVYQPYTQGYAAQSQPVEQPQIYQQPPYLSEQQQRQVVHDQQYEDPITTYTQD